MSNCLRFYNSSKRLSNAKLQQRTSKTKGTYSSDSTKTARQPHTESKKMGATQCCSCMHYTPKKEFENKNNKNNNKRTNDPLRRPLTQNTERRPEGDEDPNTNQNVRIRRRSSANRNQARQTQQSNTQTQVNSATIKVIYFFF